MQAFFPEAVARRFVPPPGAEAKQEATESTGRELVSWVDFIHEMAHHFT
jgi:hypothetical protein